MTLKDLPAVNATLNGTSGVLLMIGFACIKAKNVKPHAILMIAAVLCSVAFLTCYLIYHLQVGTTRVAETFPNVSSSIRTIYYLILFPHLTLAIVVLPLIGRSLYLAYKRRWESHRWISRYTFFIWLYVSVTGVIIYWMLYHLFPKLNQV